MTAGPGAASAVARVAAAYRRLAAVDRPEVWVSLRSEGSATAAAREVDERRRSGEGLALAGVLLAVKDNIDVLGFPTTAGCPAFAYDPAATAPAVQRLVDAGAVVLGKANLDQFATGLVGTRSPYGAVRSAGDPSRVAGGSSSGSAVAVALGVADIGVATDTAGSGRVPAALNGIVGVKPTRGLVPTTGVVPASRPHDCVSVLARTLPEAVLALRVMTGVDAGDPLARSWPPDVRLAAPPAPRLRLAVPRDADLAPLSPGRRAAFASVVSALVGRGATATPVGLGPFLRAAALMYDGAIVAERHAAVGGFVDGHMGAVDPVVGSVVAAAGRHSAPALARDQARLDGLRASAREVLAGFDALVLPTAPTHPTLAEVAADPIGPHRTLGTYTNFVNLLDMAAVAVPAGTADGTPFGVSVVVRAFEDQVALDVASLLSSAPSRASAGPRYVTEGVELVVFGAHMRGEPLNDQLVSLGAAFVDDVVTTDAYRMFALPTTPAKPGIVPVGPGRGAPLRGERWLLSPAALGRFLASLPAPMSLGRVVLADGSSPIGFLCAASATVDAPDITASGGWRAHLATETRTSSPRDGQELRR